MCSNNSKKLKVSVGDRYKNNANQWATVVKYKGAKNVFVVFDGESEEQSFRASHLRDGKFRSRSSYAVEVGTIYKSKWGSCKVIEYVDNRNILVEFQDSFKYRVRAAKTTLENGLVKNLYRRSLYGRGYLGECGVPLTKGSIALAIYELWKSLIQRCFDRNFKKAHPTYEDCTLQEDWECFAEFYKWCEEKEYFNIGYDLDKDLLMKGNKHYSEDTCVFLPRELNANISNKTSLNTTGFVGVSYEKRSGKYYASCRINGKTVSLGHHKTPEEASAAYVKAKEDYIHSLAEKWHGKIEERAYQALMNWTVYP